MNGTNRSLTPSIPMAFPRRVALEYELPPPRTIGIILNEYSPRKRMTNSTLSQVSLVPLLQPYERGFESFSAPLSGRPS
jgi:hypothetical protein